MTQRGKISVKLNEMVMKRALYKKRLAGYRTGLLALAADRSATGGPCLTGEEMALLVEGRCSRQQKEGFLQHLAHCGDCYREWLVVHEEVRRSRPGRRGKIIPFCGSALALAASVVLFLQINPDQPGMVNLERQQESVKEMPSALQPVEKPGGGEMAEEPVEEEDTVLKQKPVRVETRQREVKDVATKKKVAKRAVVAGSAARMMSDGAVLQAPQPAPQKVDDWLQEVLEGCRRLDPDPAFWQQLAGRGDGLKDDRVLIGAQGRNYTEILRLVREMESADIRANCQAIMKRVDEKTAR